MTQFRAVGLAALTGAIAFSCGVPMRSASLAEAAMSGTLAQQSVAITLAASQDDISLTAVAEDPATLMVTYAGTDEMGHPGNPGTVNLNLAPRALNFDIVYHVSGFALAVNTQTEDAYTIHFAHDGDETSAVVRTVGGEEVASATAVGDWELAYPPTQGANLTGLLAVIALGGETGCDPTYERARSDCVAQCGGENGIETFSYSCNPDTGEVSTTCECESGAGT